MKADQRNGGVAKTAPAAQPDDKNLPDWARGLRYLLSAHSQFVVSGNIRDEFLLYRESRWLPYNILDVLWEVFSADGYEVMLVYDQIDGLDVYPNHLRDQTLDRRKVAADITGVANETTDIRKEPVPMKPNDLLPILKACVAWSKGSTQRRVAFVIDYASRLSLDTQQLSEEMMKFFPACEKLANTATRSGDVFNPIIWLVNRELDFPIWFAADNPRVHSLVVPLPIADDRRKRANDLDLFGGEDNKEECRQALVDLTDGLPLSAVDGIERVARKAGIAPDTADKVAVAVRIFKLGVVRNYWAQEDVHDKLRNMQDKLENDVKGQKDAITATVVRLQRAAMGLSGAQTSASSRRPRAVLLFAGPTGVGKTELVRAVTRQMFATEDACVRFDMSEFSAEHADQRLLGAPPGYVGYDAGGELTNAVRTNPFRVLLFDEIEKAHPRILDKFLQILEDGRLTDGRGNTVYFSECVIFFTTNLGMYKQKGQDTDGRPIYEDKPAVDADTKPSEMRGFVRKGIESHFKDGIKRPEILNRIGENIIVFDFIRDLKTIADILSGAVAKVKERVKNQCSITLELSDEAWNALKERASHHAKENGGRGINNCVEEMLVNPLAGYLFTTEPPEKAAVTATAVSVAEDVAKDKVRLVFETAVSVAQDNGQLVFKVDNP